jgi:ATP-dependent helicase HepA
VFRPGSKLVHPFNPELGIGIVRAVEGRFLTVFFPQTKEEMVISAEAGLRRLVLAPGDRARYVTESEEVEIAEARDHTYLLADGRVVDDAEIWPLIRANTPIEQLANLRLDSLDGFRNRLHGLELMQLREAGGLGSFLGGRIELFPHQLWAARRAVETDPVRWLLADEVGLGKTVEACLILSALLRTGRADRALVVAPPTLTIQWLGELYRKFHQVFALIDEERIESVETDFGEGVNPFEVHPFAVISLELLASSERLLEQAGQAGLDVIVLDEAHRLARPAHLEAMAPLVRSADHALLLTATPLQANREGFYNLLSLLHPKLFPDYAAFDAAVESGEAALPCTSAVRRVDVGGLPPRVPTPVDLDPATGDLESDPRVRWLVEQVPRWKRAREKALVFVHDLEVLKALAAHLERTTRTRVTVFHEALLPAKRDIEIASFRESSVPVLLCTEAGGEGRNFQFCHRMVHYDLPLDPVELEQRIGRLDRIGREIPVEIVYFRYPVGELQASGADLARLYERLDLFSRPAAGLDAALAVVRPSIESARASNENVDLDQLVAKVDAERAVAGRDLAQVFYPDAYRPELADELLGAVPDDLEDRTRRFCVGAAEDLGFDCADKGGASQYYIEIGARATVDSLPGVSGGTRFLGTFDREEAVAKEEIEFFASGHPLVEGLLLELEDGLRGRAALMELSGEGIGGAGLLLIYKDGPEWSVEVVGADGERKPEWVRPVLDALPNARGVKAERWGIGAGWAEGIRALAANARGAGKVIAAAFFRA